MRSQSNSDFSCSATMAQTTMDDTSPAITYLPTQEDWVFANMPGWFNDTLQYVPLHEPSVPRVDVFLYPQFHPDWGSTGTVRIQWRCSCYLRNSFTFPCGLHRDDGWGDAVVPK